MPTYAVEAMEVYPQQIGAIDYGYGKTNEVVKINVEFAYKYWRNMSSTTSSLSFGRNTCRHQQMLNQQMVDCLVCYHLNYKECRKRCI